MTSKRPIASTMNRRTFIRAGAALAGALPLLEASAASNPRVIQAAKKEGSVSLYSSASSEATGALADAFDKKYGIDVTVYCSSSADIAARTQSEESLGNVQANVLIVEEPELSLLMPHRTSLPTILQSALILRRSTRICTTPRFTSTSPKSAGIAMRS